MKNPEAKEITLKKTDRVVLFFAWSTGESDFIDLPFGLLKQMVKLVEKYDQGFVPMVLVGKKKYYFGTEKGTLRPL